MSTSEAETQADLQPHGFQGNEEDVHLIKAAQTGNHEAFSELVHRHHRGVINVVYRMCGDAWLAQDAAQVAFIKAWENLPRFLPQDQKQVGNSFRNWLYRIAINAAHDMLRREKKTVSPENQSLSDQQESVEHQQEQRERQTRIRQAVLDLPSASRAVLVLREYEGLSYKEISNTLEIPLGTVMSRLNYARNHLAESLREYMEELHQT